MIVINKKRLQIITTCIVIGVFAFYFQIANTKNNLEENQNTVQTTATPVSGKTIVIDAGHQRYLLSRKFNIKENV